MVLPKVEGRLFRMHSYHLKRASLVFSDMFRLPTTPATSEEGATENDPVVLDVKADDFENLLWFFYDSPYEWYVHFLLSLSLSLYFLPSLT